MSSFFMNEKKLLPACATSFLFFICANSHERDITAWAFSSSMLDVALISLEMTLSRYFSTGRLFIAHILSASTTSRSSPRKVCVSFRSQWKLIPMVTSKSENDALSVFGKKQSSLYWLPFHRIPPSENSTICFPVIVSPFAEYSPLSENSIFSALTMPT